MQTSNGEDRETGRLIGSDKVEGTPVNDRAGNKLGNVERVMIDKQTGRVAYAVLSFGGFLGIGERYHPLPWSLLDYDTAQAAYVVDLDRDTLERAPTIGREERVDWDLSAYGRQIHDFYRVAPYWM